MIHSFPIFTKRIFSGCRLFIYRCAKLFSHNRGMIIPWCGEIGTVKFPHSSLKAQYLLHSWHSSRGENKFPHSRLRRSWGNLSSPLLLRHSWGKYCAFRDSWGNFFPPLVALPLEGKNPVPISPH